MEAWEIEAFLAIAKSGSLTQAAKLLHLSQSAVSYRLQKLETGMQATLIERQKGHRRIQLTPMGEEFVGIAERWQALLHEVDILQNQGPRISLSIGAVDSLNAFVLPPLYKQLTSHDSPISLQVRTHQTVELYDLIDRREIDVAFVLQEHYHRDLEVRRIFDELMVVLTLASSNQVAHIHPHDLSPENELHINWGSEYQLWHDQWWDPLHPYRVRVDTAQLILGLMHKPDQWAIVPISMARWLSKSGQFKFHYLLSPPPERICYRVVHRHPKSSTVKGLQLLDDLLVRVMEMHD